MNPEKQDQLTENVVHMYNAIEEEILYNMAIYLKKHNGKLTKENIRDWQVLQLSQLGALTQSNVITIVKYSGLAIDEVSKALEIAQYEAVSPYATLVKRAVQLGLLIAPTAPAGLSLGTILSSYIAQASSTLNLVNTTMLDGARQAYINIVNTTVGMVITGALSPEQALTRTLQQWADKGLPAIVDKLGRRWSPDAYVRMVTRSTLKNTAVESQFARMEQDGIELVQTSSHIGARPLCAPYQGRIYFKGRGPNTTKYPDWSSTSYGEPAGLLGINCHHAIYPFIEGMNTQTFFPPDSFENDKAYKQSVVQRSNERAIRKAKTELAMMEALNDAEGIKKARAKVREKQATMRAFINETGRGRRYEREAPASQIIARAIA